MSALGTLAAGAVSGIWKAAAVVLAAALLLVASSTGTGWWLAAGRSAHQCDPRESGGEWLDGRSAAHVHPGPERMADLL